MKVTVPKLSLLSPSSPIKLNPRFKVRDDFSCSLYFNRALFLFIFKSIYKDNIHELVLRSFMLDCWFFMLKHIHVEIVAQKSVLIYTPCLVSLKILPPNS